MQDTRSAGALAGLAIAIVFTWRLLRSPSGPQRRQPKRQAPPPTSSSSGIHIQPSVNLIPPAVCSPSEDSKAQNVIDEFFQPVKVTGGHLLSSAIVYCIILNSFKFVFVISFAADSGTDREAEVE